MSTKTPEHVGKSSKKRRGKKAAKQSQGGSPDAALDPAPTPPQRAHSKSLTELDKEANSLVLSAFGVRSERDGVETPPKGFSRSNSFTGPAFSKMSLSSIMPSLSGLSLSRTNTNEERRGRSKDKAKGEGVSSRGSSRSAIRSMSPFRRRSRTRERSPSVEALRRDQSDVDSDTDSGRNVRAPRNAFADRDSPSDSDEENEEDLSDGFNEETEDNTERNAVIEMVENFEEAVDHEPDPLGEGVNVVRPDEPLFQPQAAPGNPRRKRTLKGDVLPLTSSPPHFQKNRCSVTIIHGDPSTHCVGRPKRRYMVASDLSEESKYAVEWGIGTVLKDGDEMTIVTVSETDTKLDDAGQTSDKLAKIRNQQDRQALAYLLSRQATALLQRTRLHVTVKCQAVHAKNSRHALLDLIDAIQPIMVIVGSRGIGKLKGILLGSTSHYLIQKSSVPVMVARRRLKRPVRHSQAPPRRTNPVPLAEANIEKAGSGSAEKNVQQIRDEIAQEEASRKQVGIAPTLSPTSPISPAMGTGLRGAADSDTESESEEDQEGVKVAGKP
ncbi:hypothetical protein FRC17_004329 [Serendipita sp. 399]|nr:hypothetical protein FRC17_004329 [Serendipita sp. 399]